MKYRKKPVVIEAMQLTNENKDEVFNWVDCNKAPIYVEGIPALQILTLEGVVVANLGDWVIKGIKGEFYPCKPDIFEQTYEKVEE